VAGRTRVWGLRPQNLFALTLFGSGFASLGVWGAKPPNPRSASHKFSRICTNRIMGIQGFVKIRENSWQAEQGFWGEAPKTLVCTNPVWFWLRQLRGFGAKPPNPRSASHKFSRICMNRIMLIQGFVKIRENSWQAEQGFGGFAPKPLFALTLFGSGFASLARL